jgi:hypothetical protein
MEKGPAFRTLKQELAWGRFSPLSQLYPFICFLNKFDKKLSKQNKNLLFYFPFIMRGKNILTSLES